MPTGTADSQALCGRCLIKRPPFSLARAGYEYQGSVAALIHRLKYIGDRSALGGIRQLLSSMDLTFCKGADYLVPVPLHPVKLRRRGFNQAILLAELIQIEKKPTLARDLVKRVKNTAPQMGLSQMRRKKMIRNAFAVDEKFSIDGAEIVLVDDVYTTGATVKECSKALLKAGARQIFVVTLARVSPTVSQKEKIILKKL